MTEGFWSGQNGGRRQPDRCQTANANVGIAHDFRNMLQLATSGVSVVRRHLHATSQTELASTLEDALEALDRGNRLAHRLMSRGTADPEFEPVLIQRIIPELRTLLSHALGDGISLESLVAGDLGPVPCDGLLLENVLVNLAVNARHAMPDGGTLFIEAVRCTRFEHHNCISLSVTDTGCGMSAETAEHAFLPYFSTRLLDGGSGLGLFNVRVFAESLGGSVELFTGENRGTRVILHLPSVVSVGGGAGAGAGAGS